MPEPVFAFKCQCWSHISSSRSTSVEIPFHLTPGLTKEMAILPPFLHLIKSLMPTLMRDQKSFLKDEKGKILKLFIRAQVNAMPTEWAPEYRRWFANEIIEILLDSSRRGGRLATMRFLVAASGADSLRSSGRLPAMRLCLVPASGAPTATEGTSSVHTCDVNDVTFGPEPPRRAVPVRSSIAPMLDDTTAGVELPGQVPS